MSSSIFIVFLAYLKHTLQNNITNPPLGLFAIKICMNISYSINIIIITLYWSTSNLIITLQGVFLQRFFRLINDIKVTPWLVSAYDFYSRVVKDR